jgi:hypothetical protein
VVAARAEVLRAEVVLMAVAADAAQAAVEITVPADKGKVPAAAVRNNQRRTANYFSSAAPRKGAAFLFSGGSRSNAALRA